jgi:hypothetical protein
VGPTLVAIKLTERVVDAIVSSLQTNLATELTAIDTERGDGITMDAPANADYYKRPTLEIGGGTVRVEVYENSLDIINPYTDQDAERGVFESEITIRLTLFNRDQSSAADMRTRLRRYAAGLYGVFIRNPRLGGSDAAIQGAVIGSIDWDASTGEDDDEAVRKVQVIATATVRCEETYA